MSEKTDTINIFAAQITSENDHKRVDVYLSEQLASKYSRSQLRAFFDEELVLVNGNPVRASAKLNIGQSVELRAQTIRPVNLAPKTIPQVGILFEDEDILVVNKPAGLIVHAGAGETGTTLVDAIMLHTRERLSMLDPARPGIVHRLDKNTSGVLVCAKTDDAHHHLVKQFASHSNFRQYLTLLNGVLPATEITHQSMIARDLNHRIKMCSLPYVKDNNERGKFAKSTFKVQKTYFHRLTLASVELETGRTHQVRLHARDLRAPVVGDELYGHDLHQQIPSEIRLALKEVRQLLHARYLGIEHPRTGEKIAFEAPLPEDFQQALDSLDQYSDH